MNACSISISTLTSSLYGSRKRLMTIRRPIYKLVPAFWNVIRCATVVFVAAAVTNSSLAQTKVADLSPVRLRRDLFSSPSNIPTRRISQAPGAQTPQHIHANRVETPLVAVRDRAPAHTIRRLPDLADAGPPPIRANKLPSSDRIAFLPESNTGCVVHAMEEDVLCGAGTVGWSVGGPSRTRWTLVPEMPKDETPARRGREGSGRQSVED